MSIIVLCLYWYFVEKLLYNEYLKRIFLFYNESLDIIIKFLVKSAGVAVEEAN